MKAAAVGQDWDEVVLLVLTRGADGQVKWTPKLG